MKTGVVIRPFHPGDYDEVNRIWQELFPDNFDQSDNYASIRRFLSRNAGQSFIAEKNGRIVGTVLAGHDTRRGYVYHLGVLPDFRRLGIGKALLETVENALAQQGVLKLHLFVFQNNHSAMSFYQNTGYRIRDDIFVCSKALPQTDPWVIEPICPGEEKTVSLMIAQVFDQFVGPGYSAAGNATFKQFIQPDETAKRLINGNFILTAKVGERIIGTIEIKALSHISLLFVDREFHRRGVARKLWETAFRRCRELRGDTVGFTVNASPYAVPIYRKLGFEAVGLEQERDGIRFIPMIYNIKH